MVKGSTIIFGSVIIALASHFFYLSAKNLGRNKNDIEGLNSSVTLPSPRGDSSKDSHEEGLCCCSINRIKSGNDNIVGLLNSITRHPFFRYFKVNLEKPCPYWAVQLLCTSGSNSCQVCTCDENNVPESLKYPYDMSDPFFNDSRVSHEHPKPENVDTWGNWKNSGTEAVYVDLVENPEANTGYSGPMASRVWQAIYNENCVFNLTDNESGKCKEQYLFKRLISGLHTSITLHVATFFHSDSKGDSPLRSHDLLNSDKLSFYPNCGMFKRVTNNTEFLNNLYTLYQFTLRALTKAKSVFISDLNSFNSGANGYANGEDIKLHSGFNELFNSLSHCSSTFDESEFFQSPKASLLIPQMKRMMHNITTLMDCVNCEKCRAWGKLETMGLATAIKIVLLPIGDNLTLSRGEKVTLVNFVRQLAISVKNVHVVADVCQKLNYTGK
ncbi:putative Endoplasmic Reticulum Oxidoreductin 1 (ERO1) [Trypanosoma vivax]|uniref:Putative endoplasmic reticulum oxidoreductin n=1 Tax=Trypanosoma vivax (strain Y486) TaxID=1055687 RepID=G0U171_TRYVY|nr:putative endoplasmic reticulum oxidoreductin [Trypanosoma vivax]KAH8609262.1 putative Endoplasmic Reticulum Oxidoreductin 1 (ERO1) [Trypanosoma vivax]KAH8620046.1 putative Endoplasmic Reticulum Oxidoreductin 1 (ERO1) [Trypanosoma vivax]CCC49826.1 putative endoplasmic reticulum oxidoreductin [Trypanosoma vivax Y486]